MTEEETKLKLFNNMKRLESEISKIDDLPDLAREFVSITLERMEIKICNDLSADAEEEILMKILNGANHD